jgi:carbonic anhydrase
MFEEGEIGIVGAFYQVETGEVNFMKENFIDKK